jgi:hypothetical protein
VNLCAAQPYEPSYPDSVDEPWRWLTYAALDGNDIFCLAKGADGSTWFGIDGGAGRYDGLHWDHYVDDPNLVGQAVSD